MPQTVIAVCEIPANHLAAIGLHPEPGAYQYWCPDHGGGSIYLPANPGQARTWATREALNHHRKNHQ